MAEEANDFQVGIANQEDLISELEAFGGYAQKFIDAYNDLYAYFKEGSDKLWQGEDAKALSTEVTKNGGVLEQLTLYHREILSMKKLADEIRNAIVEAQTNITNKITGGIN